MIKPLIFGALAFFVSFVLSRLVIHFLGAHLLDTPNFRSSHQIATPRGGGIALAGGVIISSLTALQLGFVASSEIYLLIFLSGLMATLGACDDLLNLPVNLRLIVQFVLAVAGVLYIRSGAEWTNTIELLSIGVSVLFVVWMTNLYNFMDGINGLASLEAMSVCIGMAIIYGIRAQDIYLQVIIGASACGFLLWNFPRAKLFMGDSGSLFLGFIFGLIIISCAEKDLGLASAWLILLAVFITDASYTLAYRFFTKQAVHQAHKTHAYQKLAGNLSSHTLTSLSILAINLAWLLPIAIAVAKADLNPIVGIVVAYAPLIFAAHKLQAGRAN